MEKLTQTVKKGGCAAKVAATELRAILGGVKFPPQDENVLVDGGLFDDAAIYKVNDSLALVQTLDFFTPIVDSPRIFGKVAAANALSDVYAMGGIPKTALAILAFPLGTLKNEVITEVLQGAADVIGQARANFLGGHSIDDDTLKFGLSVTGYVNPQNVWSNSKAKPGDVLILTKKIGTGTVCAALKNQEIAEDQMQDALESMMQLNKVPQILSAKQLHAIHGATDITGFGLMGHSLQMAQASRVKFILEMSKIPYFERAPEFLEKDFLTKAHFSNEKYVNGKVFLNELSEIQKLLCFDPQTSGGLLLSVDPKSASELLVSIRKEFPFAEVVGKVTENELGAVSVEVNG